MLIRKSKFIRLVSYWIDENKSFKIPLILYYIFHLEINIDSIKSLIFIITNRKRILKILFQSRYQIPLPISKRFFNLNVLKI